MRVLVVGGGKVGTFIASELVGAGHEVVILDADAQRVAEAADTGAAAGAEWVVGDACEIDDLAAVHPERADVVVAVTGDDEDNLVVSLLAKQEYGAPRVIARVNNPDNEWLFNETWGVDVSVSTPHLLTALVEEAVTVGSLVRLLALGGGAVRLSEVRLAEGTPAAGRSIVDLGFPRGSTVVAVIRGDSVVVPRGDTTLAAGDEVLVLADDDSEDAVRALLVGG
ncbi:MAG: potassium channel family protein [Microthrixaceae bacterium]